MTAALAASGRTSAPGRTTVAEAMHAGLVTCAPHLSLAVIARIMAAHRIHAVVVAEPAPESGGPIVLGVVSDLDVVAALADGALGDRTAGDAARTPPLCVHPRDRLERAVALMREHRTTHVVVVDPVRRRPVGVLSTLDVAEVIAQDT